MDNYNDPFNCFKKVDDKIILKCWEIDRKLKKRRHSATAQHKPKEMVYFFNLENQDAKNREKKNSNEW